MLAELGMQDDKPIRHLGDYLSILVPLIEEGRAGHQGESISCRAGIFRPAGRPPQILVAALRPTSRRQPYLWHQPRMGRPKTIRDHIVPTIRSAADAGRDEPRVLATLPICVTEQPDEIRNRVTAGAAMYAKLPSHQALFEREGVTEPGQLGLVSSETTVEEMLADLAEVGVTDSSASEFTPFPNEREETRALAKPGRPGPDIQCRLAEAGHSDFRDARGPMGFNQRQAGGKFTRGEADAFIEQLQSALLVATTL